MYRREHSMYKDYLQFQASSLWSKRGLLYIIWGFVFIQKEWAFKYSLFYALHLYHILWMIFHVTVCLCMNMYTRTHVYCTYRVCSSVALSPLSQMTAEAPLSSTSSPVAHPPTARLPAARAILQRCQAKGQSPPRRLEGPTGPTSLASEPSSPALLQPQAARSQPALGPVL